MKMKTGEKKRITNIWENYKQHQKTTTCKNFSNQSHNKPIWCLLFSRSSIYLERAQSVLSVAVSSVVALNNIQINKEKEKERNERKFHLFTPDAFSSITCSNTSEYAFVSQEKKLLWLMHIE